MKRMLIRRKTGIVLWVVGLLACISLALPEAGAGAESAEAGAPEGAGLEPFGGFGGPMTLGPEGALWFTNGKKLGKIEAAEKLTELPLSTSIGPARDIVAGPDGALWATSKSEIDRITIGGKVTRFPLPAKDGEAGSIAVAEDGTLWVTTWARQHAKERSFGKAYVVRLTPGGDATSFTLPGPARQREEAPGSVVAGPGGDIWFTDPGLGRFGRFTPDGKLAEFHNRLRPEALVADSAGGLWFVGSYGVGTIAAEGTVRELRVGNFYELGIGGGYDAINGPEGNLWFIGGATRVMRMTPSGHLDVLRNAGPPAARHMVLAADGTIWVSAEPHPIKGPLYSPLLHFRTGLPGIEVEPAIARVKGGRVPVPLSCGGSATACSGEVTMSFGHKREAKSHYEVAAESGGKATIALPPEERRTLAQSGFLRVSVFATVEGGGEGFTQLVLRAPKLPAPRPGHPLLLPLPENIEPRGWVRAPDGFTWAGSDVGRFTRISPTGDVSTVVVPGLGTEPVPIGFDAQGDLWFSEYHYEDALSVLGRLSPDGKLEQVHLPAGPTPAYEAAIGPHGELWVPRSDYSRAAELDKVAPSGKVRRFAIGTEPGALTPDRRGGIWFSGSGPQIVHLAANGRRHVFPIPHDGFVNAIALGRHGALWFTHWARHVRPSCAIGHLSPGGGVVEYPVPHVGELFGISIKRNGDLAFETEFPSGEGRISPQGNLISLHRHRQARGSQARTVAIPGEG
jgi:streptogramin lyase